MEPDFFRRPIPVSIGRRSPFLTRGCSVSALHGVAYGPNRLQTQRGATWPCDSGRPNRQVVINGTHTNAPLYFQSIRSRSTFQVPVPAVSAPEPCDRGSAAPCRKPWNTDRQGQFLLLTAAASFRGLFTLPFSNQTKDQLPERACPLAVNQDGSINRRRIRPPFGLETIHSLYGTGARPGFSQPEVAGRDRGSRGARPPGPTVAVPTRRQARTFLNNQPSMFWWGSGASRVS